MPLVRINHPAGKPAAFRTAISRGVYRAMLDTFNVPVDDDFQVLSESGPGTEMVRPEQYLGIKYSDDLTFIQITCNDTRTVDQKKAFYAAIADNLTRDPGLRREDILISLVEVKKENWTFGNGIAQYAT
ncbi:MAG: tautomerase enzyme family protein [Bradyrhizobium sp.]|jgi:4-oxalocrotonate tautomerase|nr:tautomerase enzyme family protein [Bradyrhizobium sp.]